MHENNDEDNIAKNGSRTSKIESLFKMMSSIESHQYIYIFLVALGQTQIAINHEETQFFFFLFRINIDSKKIILIWVII